MGMPTTFLYTWTNDPKPHFLENYYSYKISFRHFTMNSTFDKYENFLIIKSPSMIGKADTYKTAGKYLSNRTSVFFVLQQAGTSS